MDEECSKRVHKEVHIDYAKTEECVNRSFESSDWDTADNSLLRDDEQKKEKDNVGFLPEVTINGVVYKGDLEPELVFRTICESFVDKPAVCDEDRTVTSVEQALTTGALALLFAAVIGINCCVLVVSIRKRNNSLREELKGETLRQIQEYMQVRDQEMNSEHSGENKDQA